MRDRRTPVRTALAAVVGAVLFAAGCTVGPDHVRPAVETPAAFVRDASATPIAAARADSADAGVSAAGVSTAGADRAGPAGDRFWQRFDDPLLARLVDDALAANTDLRIALARLDEARALARLQRFDFAPTVTAGAGAEDRRASATQAPGLSRAARDATTYDAGIGIAWEPDLFGRARRASQARLADAAAAEADLAAAQVAIVAEVARTYFELRGAQARLAAGRAGAALQQGTLALVEARLQAGRGTPLDSARAQVELASTQARLPRLEAEAAAAMHRLGVLAGRPPGTFVATLAAPGELPAADVAISPGTPGDLLRRRPDVAAAERRLEAATARIGVATADLFPRFTLGALLGSHAGDRAGLFGRDAESGFVALGIDWSFLDTGRVRARIAAAEAGADGELARYERAVLIALEETETALSRHAQARAERERLEVAANAAAVAAGLARTRFEAGLVDLLSVIDAERARVETDDLLAQSRTRSATALVDVYRALAGGWPERLPERIPVAVR